MRNRRNILMVMCLLAITTVWAGPVGERQALRIAEKFMSNRSMGSTSLKKVHKAPMTATANSEKAAYYVFNANRGGFVIVAGDDRAPAVLGYSDNGTFDNQDVPEAMQLMLDGYVAQLTALEQGAKAAPQLTSGSAIKPLVKAEWSQNEPFNTRFPVLDSGSRAVVGCVATALAQVMYYWKWPARPTQPIAAYTTQQLNIYMEELPVVGFNWDAMQNNYETSDTESEGAVAVATLSLYCAQALQMDFYGSSSGASSGSIPSSAATYFDYDASAHLVSRTNYSTQGWADLICSELAAGRPVIYSGSKRSAGHAFVCDGYDGNGMFHINWGWNGKSNGYFLLNVLNPEAQGTGSASGAYGYIMDQEAIVGFQPDKGGSSIFEISAFDVALNSCTSTRTSTNESFEAVVLGKFQNNTPDVIDASFGWGLFDVDGGMLIDNLISVGTQGLSPGHFTYLPKYDLSFGAGISSGTYRIMPMYSEFRQNNWRPCVGADRNYIEVTIDGNQCTATGYGTAGTRNYTINDITFTGTMNNGRPVNMEVNMTNNGQSSNELLYMFVGGQFAAAGYVGLEPGETGDIPYSYLFNSAGTYTLTWSWNDDGINPIATRSITINQMPSADLSISIQVLNVSDTDGSVIASDKFSAMFTITNNGQTTYDEDISAELYKFIGGNSGSPVQGISQHLTLAPGATTTMQFDMTNVSDGWKYFIRAAFYSEGVKRVFNPTTIYTIVFPEEPEVEKGNVNGDDALDIADVTALVDIILGKDATGYNLDAADVNGDTEITIADVAELVKIILGGSAPAEPDYYVGWLKGKSFSQFAALDSSALIAASTAYSKSVNPTNTKTVDNDDVSGVTREIYFLMWKDGSAPTGGSITSGGITDNFSAQDFLDTNVFNATHPDVSIGLTTYHVVGLRGEYDAGDSLTVRFN